MQVADVIAQILKREGVEVLLAYLRNPIIEAAARADIRTIIVQQERTACTWPMLSAGSAPAAGSACSPCRTGPEPRTPSGGRAGVRRLRADPRAAGRLPAQSHERPTQLQSFRPISKWCDQLTRPADVCEILRRAFSQIRNGRPGPVVVEKVEAPTLYEPGPTARSGPDPASVSKAVDALLAAKRPLLYAGQGVHYVRAWEALHELAELLQVPVATSLQGKSVFP